MLVILALALLIVDPQLRVLEPVRRAVSVALYPSSAPSWQPRDLVQQVDEWINAASLIRSENEALQRQRIELAQVATHAAQLAAENAQLRRLLGVTDTVAQSAVVVEVLYEPPNAFHQRLVSTRAPNRPGARHAGHRRGRRGRPDRARSPPMTAEAALVTDERVSIPVQVLRNGPRLIAFGANTPA